MRTTSISYAQNNSALNLEEADYTTPIESSTAQYTAAGGTGNPIGICIDFTFTNLLRPYTLPNSVGSGLWPYALAGLALCAGRDCSSSGGAEGENHNTYTARAAGAFVPAAPLVLSVPAERAHNIPLTPAGRPP